MISNPNYFDFDCFIDRDHLRALDQYVRERLEKRIEKERDLRFYTGPFILKADAPPLPGSRMVYLSRTSGPDDYYDLDRTDLWAETAEAEEFPELMAFIRTLPFKGRGRMIIIYDMEGRAVPAHRDHDSVDLCHEFIWFRTNLDKPFFMLNPDTGERLYVRSHAAWFDTVNQYHGAEETGKLSWSIRVDGVFDDALRARIPYPEHRISSAPAHMAASAMAI